MPVDFSIVNVGAECVVDNKSIAGDRMTFKKIDCFHEKVLEIQYYIYIRLF